MKEIIGTVVEYQTRDSIIRIARIPTTDNRRYTYKFEYQTADQTKPATRINTAFRTLSSALKQFNQAVSALNAGTNIRIINTNTLKHGGNTQ